MQLYTNSKRTRPQPKFIATLLILLLNLTPLSPVFADLPPQPTVKNADVFSDTAQPHINGSTGAFTQSYSLDIPPGRNGLQPDVTLDYSSQRTQDSIVGYGWQLSIPYIQRLNKTGSQDLYGNTPYYSSSVDGELTNSSITATSSSGTSSPAILDTLPVTTRYSNTTVTSDSFTYTVPSGSNKLLVVLVATGNGGPTNQPSATQNGTSLTCSSISGSSTRGYHYYCYLANPSSGTFSMSWPTATVFQSEIFTLQNAAQSSPIDASSVNDITSSGSTLSTSVTTTQGNDLLLSQAVNTGATLTTTYGAGETEIVKKLSSNNQAPLGDYSGTYKNAAASAGTETMTRNYSPNDNNDDFAVVAVKNAPVSSTNSYGTTTVYSYGAIGYANPDAVSSIGNGLSTTTYTYDANGNLAQTGGWSYVWDYLNRMLASGYNNSTTTYAYDPSGARVLQTSTTSTTYYPNKYYSFTSTKIGANTYATSTNYIWNGDALLATIDQPLYNGSATGSPITRYIHPDHLGSTNVVTDASGTVAQLLDYYPYGATRIATSTYPTNEKRQYIGQFSDAQTNLNYLNARFYDSARGQFMSQDPEFLGTKQKLRNPQSLNPYSYANDNPITKEDPSGNAASLSSLLNQLASLLTQLYSALGSMNTASYSRGGSSGGSGGSSAPAATAKPQPPVGYGGGTTMNDYFNYQFSQAVKSYVGAPYNEKTDAVGPDYFDCSGAVVAGIRKVANPKFGRYTADQLYNNYTTPLPDTGGSGTLIFYNNKVPSNPDGIDHVATYVGNGMIVDPNGTQGQVKLNPASYESNYTTKNGGNVYNAQIDWNEVMSDQ